MYCSLCIKTCESNNKLFGTEGQQTEIYVLTAFYFKELLTKNTQNSENIYGQDKLLSVICDNCWQHIKEFDSFRSSIEAAQRLQQDLHENIKFEQIFQTENNIIEEKIPAFDINERNLSTVDEEFILERCNLDLTSNENNQNKKENALKQKATKNKKKKLKQKQKENPVKYFETGKVGEAKIADEDKRAISATDAFIEEYVRGDLKCGLCSTYSKNFRNLRVHFRESHKNVKPYTVCCARKYHFRCHLYDHLQVHKNPEYFKCTECNECYPNRQLLTNHVNNKHLSTTLERRFECDICHKRFAKSHVLRGHMDTHATGSKDYVCKDCNKGFVLEKLLKRHINNCHSSDSKGVCDQCGKKFRGRYALKSHLLEHEGVQKQKWACDLCNAELISKFSLGRHKRLAHHDNSTVYVCGDCGKVALTEDALRSHKRYMHQKERKFKCSICDKAFKVSTVLKEHMTTHTGEELYNCPHCPRTFKVSANMHHHRKRSHPKEWEENRQHRSLASKIDMSQISYEVVL